MKKIISIAIGSLILFGCTTKESLKSLLKENPEIIIESIESNPEKFIQVLNKAAQKAQEGSAQAREIEEKKAFEKSFENPLSPEIRKGEAFRGPANAPITLVEYSDFECPFCSRGHSTVKELMKEYEGKIRFVYKHLPLNFHPQALIASKYFEAIKLQDKEAAWKFHDKIYENQSGLKEGEVFLKKIARELKVDMTRLAKDITGNEVQMRISEDMAEASKFGFQGTPGFLINGIPVRGAYPSRHFVGIIEELKKRGKLAL